MDVNIRQALTSCDVVLSWQSEVNIPQNSWVELMHVKTFVSVSEVSINGEISGRAILKRL